MELSLRRRSFSSAMVGISPRNSLHATDDKLDRLWLALRELREAPTTVCRRRLSPSDQQWRVEELVAGISFA